MSVSLFRGTILFASLKSVLQFPSTIAEKCSLVYDGDWRNGRKEAQEAPPVITLVSTVALTMPAVNCIILAPRHISMGSAVLLIHCLGVTRQGIGRRCYLGHSHC